MSNKEINNLEGNFQSQSDERGSIKCSLSINSSNNVIKEKSGSTPKRYKSCLICMVCDGDAHGNYTKEVSNSGVTRGWPEGAQPYHRAFKPYHRIFLKLLKFWNKMHENYLRHLCSNFHLLTLIV